MFLDQTRFIPDPRQAQAQMPYASKALEPE